MDKSLVQLTASEVVEGLKKGEISPLELISAAETRILETEPAINASNIMFRKSPDPSKGFDGKGTTRVRK